MKRTTLVVAAASSLLCAGCLFGNSDQTPQYIIPIGSEEQQVGTVYTPNKFNIPNDSTSCFMGDVYLVQQVMTDLPLRGWQGKSMQFRNAKLICDKGTTPPRVVYDMLGFWDMKANGLTPMPDSPVSESVREYLLAAAQNGIDIDQVFGKIISRQHCDGEHCWTWTMNQKLTYKKGATGADVGIAPIGCMTTNLCAKGTIPPSIPWIPVAVVGVVVVLVLALVLRLRGTGGFNPATG